NPHATATRINEIEMAGPAPGRPKVPTAWRPSRIKLISGALNTEGYSNFKPAAAVPVNVKMPEPITTPIPIATKLHRPSVLRSGREGSWLAETSSSIDLVRNRRRGAVWAMPKTEISILMHCVQKFHNSFAARLQRWPMDSRLLKQAGMNTIRINAAG